jgi:Ribose/xylose/arabinose/galactoside ABC-type transport systems, permease components
VTNAGQLKNVASKYGILIVLIVLIIFFSIASPAFLTSDNLFNILRQVAIVGIVAVGMTMVLLTGGIDLSVGAIIGVAGVMAAQLMLSGVHPVWASLITLAACALLGAINGFFINTVKIPALITTLGTMTAIRGVAYLLTGGLPVFGFSSSFKMMGQGYLWIIPIPVLIMIAVFIVGYIFLNKTVYGRYIYGVGGNEEASRLSGVSVQKVKALVYTACGFLSGLAGLVLLSRVNSGQPKAGTSYEMDIITAVVLGGVSIFGGEGKINFVIIGVLIMGVLSNGMILLNINEYVQWVVKGLVLLFAVGFDRFITRRKTISAAAA